ncbi:MAG: hypothetical protein OXR72_06160 [Gemmatimonadota bacterium]|nr:hypothetical protein [Gemmatimonadota bacterium]
MGSSKTAFLPVVEKIYFFDSNVKKDVEKFTEPTRTRYVEFLDDLRLGRIPVAGKNIARQGGVLKYRLNDSIRIAFIVQGDEEKRAVILGIGDHPKMARIMPRLENMMKQFRRGRL